MNSQRNKTHEAMTLILMRVGTKLLNLVENYCRSNDIGLVSLNSGLPREGAHLFYESKGYIKKSYGFVKQIE